MVGECGFSRFEGREDTKLGRDCYEGPKWFQFAMRIERNNDHSLKVHIQEFYQIRSLSSYTIFN